VDEGAFLPFLVLVVPSHGPSGRDLGGLGRRRASWGSEIGHRSRIGSICDHEREVVLECDDGVVRDVCGRSKYQELVVDDVAGGYKYLINLVLQ
jgi:hypothetical protein